MRALFLIIFAVVLLFGVFIVDAPTMLILLIAYFIGIALTRFLNRSNKNIVSIYSILFLVSSIYMIACYLYMSDKGFIYLFAPDLYGTFYPMNEYYLQYGSYSQIVTHIWKDYQFLDRYFVGYYTYSTLWGVLAKSINANLYVTLQISTLFLYSFIGVVTYRLFLKSNFAKKAAFKYTLIISLCSIVFFYSSIFLRDIHIALLYLIAIYLTFETKFSLTTLLKLMIVILITCLFRIESGLFLFILIPVYLLICLQKSKYKITLISISAVLAIIIGFYYLSNRTSIDQIISDNREVYIESDKGSGITGTLERIPILGDFSLILYNALQPIPFFNRLHPSPNSEYALPVDNIMRFPQSIAAVFNWIVIFYLLFWLFSNKMRKVTKGKIAKPLQYNLWVGMVFFLLQSSVISQRRLIPFHIVYYILFFIIYSCLKSDERKRLNAIAMFGFILLQLVGVIYFT